VCVCVCCLFLLLLHRPLRAAFLNIQHLLLFGNTMQGKAAKYLDLPGLSKATWKWPEARVMAAAMLVCSIWIL
jgi:hypothetical protein